jgi:hypothetical protein
MAAFFRPAGKLSATIGTIAPANIASRVRFHDGLESCRIGSVFVDQVQGGPSRRAQPGTGGEEGRAEIDLPASGRPCPAARRSRPLRRCPDRARTLDVSANRRSGFPRRKRVEEDSVPESRDQTGRRRTCRPAGRSPEWFFTPGNRHATCLSIPIRARGILMVIGLAREASHCLPFYTVDEIPRRSRSGTPRDLQPLDGVLHRRGEGSRGRCAVQSPDSGSSR